jgi:glutamate 5-kinase
VRETLRSVTRVVVKLGTGVLTDPRKKLDPNQVHQLVTQLASQRKWGREVVLVTSGAVGAGMGALGFDRRPTELAELQACAAIGQSRLMATYEQAFGGHGIPVAQVLLTHEDLRHPVRHRNARNALVTLLRHGVVPIINENDAVSVTELKFGDNDRLSALVTSLLPADLLVILTTAEGLVEGFGTPEARRIGIVPAIDDRIRSLAGGTTSSTAVGGMITKIEAGRIVVRSGIPMVIAAGHQAGVLEAVLSGDDVGTLFLPAPTRLRGRKRWIAFFHHPRGAIWVDDGATRALREDRRSLLVPGVIRCDGDFGAGEVVRVCDSEGMEFARGLTRFGSEAIRQRSTGRSEVIHRDDLVTF